MSIIRYINAVSKCTANTLPAKQCGHVGIMFKTFNIYKTIILKSSIYFKLFMLYQIVALLRYFIYSIDLKKNNILSLFTVYFIVYFIHS